MDYDDFIRYEDESESLQPENQPETGSKNLPEQESSKENEQEDVMICYQCYTIPDNYIALKCEHNFCLICLGIQYVDEKQKIMRENNLKEIDKMELECTVCQGITELDGQSIVAIEEIIEKNGVSYPQEQEYGVINEESQETYQTEDNLIRDDQYNSRQTWQSKDHESLRQSIRSLKESLGTQHFQEQMSQQNTSFMLSLQKIIEDLQAEDLKIQGVQQSYLQKKAEITQKNNEENDKYRLNLQEFIDNCQQKLTKMFETVEIQQKSTFSLCDTQIEALTHKQETLQSFLQSFQTMERDFHSQESSEEILKEFYKRKNDAEASIQHDFKEKTTSTIGCLTSVKIQEGLFKALKNDIKNEEFLKVSEKKPSKKSLELEFGPFQKKYKSLVIQTEKTNNLVQKSYQDLKGYFQQSKNTHKFDAYSFKKNDSFTAKFNSKNLSNSFLNDSSQYKTKEQLVSPHASSKTIFSNKTSILNVKQEIQNLKFPSKKTGITEKHVSIIDKFYQKYRKIQPESVKSPQNQANFFLNKQKSYFDRNIRNHRL